MASVEDIRVTVVWRDHHKRKKLSRRLGSNGVVALLDLWLWTGANRPSGILTNMSDEDVEIAAQWTGEPGALISVLVDLRLVDRHEEGAIALHDWQDHQRWAAGAEVRSSASRDAADEKWGTKTTSDENRAKRSQRLAAARAKGKHTPAEWHELVSICNGVCVRCGNDRVVKDHIIPIYQGGSDSIENLQPLCIRCNSSKGPDCSDLRPPDWAERLRNACGTPTERRENAFPVSFPFVSASLPSKNTPLELLTQSGDRFDFLTLYRRYPRKEGKSRGLELCREQIRSEGDYAALGKAIDHYGALVVGRETEHVKLFSTFMGRWRDYVSDEDVDLPPAREYQPCLSSQEEIDAAAMQEHERAKQELARLTG